MKVDLPYVNSFRSHHGKMRFYFRRKGCKRVALPHADDPRFLAAYKAAVGEPWRTAIGITPGTFGALCEDYMRSAVIVQLSISECRQNCADSRAW